MFEVYKEKQKIAYQILVNSIKNNKQSHAYLFETNGNSDSDKFIKSFLKFLLCENHYINNENCNDCKKCIIIDNDNHPEIKIINPVDNVIKKEQLIELQKEFSKKAIVGNKKIYIINNAERMNSSSKNSILKFLEEPEDNIIAILVTNNRYQILETILSRCQIISLIKDKNLIGQTVKEKIANSIFSLEDLKEDFINNEKTDETIGKAVEFVNYYEKYGIKTMVYTNNLWHKYFNSKDQENEKDDSNKNIFEIGLSIVLLYYKDILNLKMNRDLEVFNGYESKMKLIIESNNYEDLSYKIKIIIESLNKIKYNINKKLLIDKLLIEMAGVVK